jgi:N-acetylneuraminate synthase/sialic acid synthase
VHREKLEPTPDEWRALRDEAARLGITFFSTPFDMKSFALLESLDVPAYKVASGDATNIPLIRAIAATGKPTMISTGGCSQAEVDRLYDAFKRVNGDPRDLAILQCSCVYPAPDDVMNLNVIPTYRARYPDTVIGLSTHNRSFIPSLAAFALGARIFEHHYTNGRTWKGTDNHFSLNPGAMRQFIVQLDSIFKALGHAEKFCAPVETMPTRERRKKLVWARQVMEHGVISEADLTEMCPAFDGIPPYMKDLFIGRRVTHTTGAGETVAWVDLFLEEKDRMLFEREFARV